MDWLLGLRRWTALFAFELGTLTAAVLAVAGGQYLQTNKSPETPFSIHATYVKGCACVTPCPNELTGGSVACKGIGAILIHSGMYRNADLAGARIVFGVQRGQWVKIYVDGRDKDQKAAAGDFARDALKDYGPVRWVQEGKIDIVGKGGDFLVSVNNGQAVQLETEPVIGGDGRTPVAHNNTRDRLNPALFQGKVNKGRYDDGEETFWLQGTNAYFNDDMLGTGRL